jgi:hypothetical protein
MRSLRAGEELTIQYTDLYLQRTPRREKLLRSHGFQCR